MDNILHLYCRHGSSKFDGVCEQWEHYQFDFKLFEIGGCCKVCGLGTQHNEHHCLQEINIEST